jgi:hypothetical protein
VQFRLTEQLIQESKYLLVVTPKTIIWHGSGFKGFEGALDSKESVNRRMMELRQRGVSPITGNSRLPPTSSGREPTTAAKTKAGPVPAKTFSNRASSPLLKRRYPEEK